jgi:two-component system OmpR family response regulator
MAQILLVEPDTALARIYYSALKAAGYKVSIASNAQSAITAADRHKPDMVILEMQLVRHNGLEFLYEFRSYPEWQKIPILLHTLVPPAEFAGNTSLWHELGVDGYMYKPRTSLKQLLRSVAAYEQVPAITQDDEAA